MKTLALGLLALSTMALSSPAAQSPAGSRQSGGPRAERAPTLRWRGPQPSFAAPVDYELSGSEPRDLEVADFDGDGNQDICVVGSGDSESSLLYGDGLGGLPDNESLQVVLGAYDPGPWGVAAGDFDGNGFLDVAAALGSQYNGLGQSNRKINLFLSDGDRAFTYAGTLSTTNAFPIDCEAGDFDEDGHVDLVGISNLGGIDLFVGVGDGSFGPRRTISTQTNGLRCDSVDLDADGHLDVIATMAGLFPYEYVYWGDGSGWDSGPAVQQGLNPGYGYAWGDVDLDGKLDVLASVPDKFPNYTGGLWVRLATGGRGFGLASRYGAAFTGTIRVGEVNGDGLPDVLGLDGLGLRTYLGEGNGSFVQVAHVPVTTDATNLTLADWNRDGLADVAWPYRNLGQTPYLTVRLNTTR